jgi:hypothetical protein
MWFVVTSLFKSAERLLYLAIILLWLVKGMLQSTPIQTQGASISPSMITGVDSTDDPAKDDMTPDPVCILTRISLRKPYPCLFYFAFFVKGRFGRQEANIVTKDLYSCVSLLSSKWSDLGGKMLTLQ